MHPNTTGTIKFRLVFHVCGVVFYQPLVSQKSSTARCVPNKRHLVAHRRSFHQKKIELFQLLIGLKGVKFDVKSEGVLLTDTSVTCLAVSCWHLAFPRARRSGFSTANRWLIVLVSFSAAWSKEKKKTELNHSLCFLAKLSPLFKFVTFNPFQSLPSLPFFVSSMIFWVSLSYKANVLQSPKKGG